ncbi:MAG: hypothetical protein ABGX42_05340 [Gammaproteobacteria bacterium]|jgi:hypothetical protein
MSYTSPKTGAKVNPGKRKKLPKGKGKTHAKKLKKALKFGRDLALDSVGRGPLAQMKKAVKKAQKKKRSAKDKVMRRNK